MAKRDTNKTREILPTYVDKKYTVDSGWTAGGVGEVDADIIACVSEEMMCPC